MAPVRICWGREDKHHQTDRRLGHLPNPDRWGFDFRAEAPASWPVNFRDWRRYRDLQRSKLPPIGEETARFGASWPRKRHNFGGSKTMKKPQVYELITFSQILPAFECAPFRASCKK